MEKQGKVYRVRLKNTADPSRHNEVWTRARKRDARRKFEELDAVLPKGFRHQLSPATIEYRYPTGGFLKLTIRPLKSAD